jgi:hypothetical protein
MTNTLAYYYTKLIVTVKSFIVQALGVNAIKLFSSSIKLQINKLECLSLASPFNLA